MISSEVQRTLVKSPPELWAELGDPASLARHLGELGEIRVTRIDPEQAVEWEAEDTTGTVLLKPSGWGTKVTLTVTRETPNADAPLSAPPPAQADHAVEREPAVETEPEPAAPVNPGPMSQHEVEPAVEVQPEPEPMFQPEPEPMFQPEPEPMFQAEPEPMSQAEPEPMSQAELEPMSQAELEDATEHRTERHPDAVAAAIAEAPEPDPELVPRRGFFSRLFGRRPRHAPAQPEPTDTSAGASPWFEPPIALDAVESQPAEAYEPVALVGPHPVEPVEWVADIEPHPVEPVEWVADIEPQPAEAYEPAASFEPEPAEPYEPAALAEPQPAEPYEPAAQTIEEPAESADARPQEISTQLEDADEAAAGEVTAVLIAVLDRLGAAHHRPFSRG